MVCLSQQMNILQIKIVVAEESKDDREEIDDLKAEFEALQDTSVDYETHFKISTELLNWPDATSIVVY